MGVEKRKRSTKERIFSFIYRIFRAIVGLFFKSKIIENAELKQRQLNKREGLPPS